MNKSNCIHCGFIVQDENALYCMRCGAPQKPHAYTVLPGAKHTVLLPNYTKLKNATTQQKIEYQTEHFASTSPKLAGSVRSYPFICSKCLTAISSHDNIPCPNCSTQIWIKRRTLEEIEKEIETIIHTD